MLGNFLVVLKFVWLCNFVYFCVWRFECFGVIWCKICGYFFWFLYSFKCIVCVEVYVNKYMLIFFDLFCLILGFLVLMSSGLIKLRLIFVNEGFLNIFLLGRLLDGWGL